MADQGRQATHRRRIALAAVTVVIGFGASGCFEDGDCGICNEHSLELQIISGTNYAGELVHLVGPTCEGDKCPDPINEARRFVETIGLCTETDAALAAGRGPHEYCRIAPIVVSSGLQFVFNNLLEPTSIELVRKRPNLPNLFETYDWKVDILRVDGPISRYSGDWRSQAGDDTHRMTRFVNRSCIDNTPPNTFDIETTDCNVLVDGVPLKLQASASLPATRGAWDDRAIGEAAEYDCETPVDGVDTCCSQCDFNLSVMVEKYGAGERITCDPQGDRLVDCAGFVVSDNRDDEYQGFVAPEDLLRATHPNMRDERATVACTSDDACRDPGGADLPGAECIGTNAGGDACSPEAGDPACTGGLCRAPWFVDCRVDPDTTGETGYCVDVRHDSDAAAACVVKADARLSELDGNADGKVTALEACPEGTSCDPAYDLAYEPLARYERKVSLSGLVRDLGCDGGCSGDQCDKCTDTGGCDGDCDDDDEQACAEQYFVTQTCSDDEDQTDYAINLVTKLGGVIYDGAIKGILWRPADRGGQPRALIEACAEERGLIAPRNVADGWRAHDVDGIGVEFEADYDRALCSGQDYEVVFQPSDKAAHVVDKKGNTLDGKRVYKFRTSQFHIMPSSGFPGDNLRIGACDTFSLKFSNKYDLSPENLKKIEIHDITDGGAVVVAGGTSCAETRADVDAEDTDLVPCLDVDVTDQASGEIHVRVDAVRFDPVLVAERTYGFHVPGISDPQANNHDVISQERYDSLTSLKGLPDAAYKAAFWDACGMPLFVATEVNYINGEPEGGADNPVLYPIYDYTFTVDPARCEEDGDGDGVQLSCDNAPDDYNPLQTDADGDGVGDPLDFCPASPEIALDTSDSDRDGVGNACDGCAKSVSRYNDLSASNALSPHLWIRGIPDQRDADEDGIGDVCDNCPTIANCAGYDVDRPWRLGDAIDPEAATCQRDANFDMVGDECVGMAADDAAGPIGLGPTDDFDQDGLLNPIDACPRQPELARIVCDGDDACGDGRECEDVDGTGVCNHLDSDDDGVGDLCDTCVHVPNGAQELDGSAQADDDDGDFIGADCEMGDGCDERSSPRPLGFFAVSASGQCCTTLLVEQGGALFERWNSGRAIVDPAGLPVSADCSGGGCRSLPELAAVTPGVLVLPPGCDAALAAAGMMTAEENRPLGLDDVQGDLDALWNMQCRLPPLDQDYDGLGDKCDLCEFDFDPTNEVYVDEEGRSWPNDGAVCSGSNSLASRCEDEIDEDTGEGGSSGDGSSDDGGSSDGGSTSSG